MGYVSAFAFYMRAMALGLLIIVGAWSSIHLDGAGYRPQWQLIKICHFSAFS
ncbi:hypothetical protein IQ254_04020 [Nodosilinea sp. LEGE 07088]|uniref:hypothetical protein n=1 Tax=Nodosilinea sp. LEGE 07088 TaxID=2777968 RepID=UPI00187E8991|nr:hypothetical protein [Nodosilinea sp. LEGE 07088]MBE9136375.1 hypothetical protein [Nodosilinea sp. LEGE 07088]